MSEGRTDEVGADCGQTAGAAFFYRQSVRPSVRPSSLQRPSVTQWACSPPARYNVRPFTQVLACSCVCAGVFVLLHHFLPDILDSYSTPYSTIQYKDELQVQGCVSPVGGEETLDQHVT